jgi:hypothetical protein
MEHPSFEINAGFIAGQNKYVRLKEKTKTINKKSQFSSTKPSWKFDYEQNSNDYESSDYETSDYESFDYQSFDYESFDYESFDYESSDY